MPGAITVDFVLESWPFYLFIYFYFISFYFFCLFCVLYIIVHSITPSLFMISSCNFIGMCIRQRKCGRARMNVPSFLVSML